MLINGTITAYDGQFLTISAPFDDSYELEKKSITDVEIRLNDGRSISNDQRRKLYAMFRDIAMWSGEDSESLKEYFKNDLISKTGMQYFSLSNCDMTTARLLVEDIIEFCVVWDVPTKDNLADYAPDIKRYVYWCLMNKVCCVSRQKTELHHFDAVGAGRNRKEIIHIGMRVLPLSKKYHSEIHTIGKETFMKKYHIVPINVDYDIAKKYGLKSR